MACTSSTCSSDHLQRFKIFLKGASPLREWSKILDILTNNPFPPSESSEKLRESISTFSAQLQIFLLNLILLINARFVELQNEIPNGFIMPYIDFLSAGVYSSSLDVVSSHLDTVQ